MKHLQFYKVLIKIYLDSLTIKVTFKGVLLTRRNTPYTYGFLHNWGWIVKHPISFSKDLWKGLRMKPKELRSIDDMYISWLVSNNL